MNLTARHALVTGGTSGVGFATCARLIELGCRVLTCGTDPDRLAAAADRLPGLRTVRADLGMAGGRADLVDRVASDLPDISLLINNAAIQTPIDWYAAASTTAVHDAALRAAIVRDTDRELAVDLVAPLHLTAALLPALARAAARADGAAVVNVTSALAVVPKRSTPAYCAAKAGLRAFTTSLRHQSRAGGVRVIEVVLPLVDTPMTAGRGGRKIDPRRAAAAMLRGVAAGRDVIHVGGVGALLLLDRLSPALAARLLRDG